MKQENKGYRRKEYVVTSKKVREPLTFLLLADLHGRTYGDGNRELLKSIEAEKADFVFVAGDMLCAKKAPEKWGGKAAMDLLVPLAKRTNVCYAWGNHESKMERNPARYGKLLQEYEETLEKTGVVLLHNDSREFIVKDTRIRISGLELTREYFKKLCSKKLTLEGLKKTLENGGEEVYQILLAHNPRFGDCYFDWGADLTLSGHNHGGVMAFPGCGGVITPQLRLFDKYTAGCFEKENKTLIISRGLGDHMLLPRIFNPREYVVIKVYPEKEKINGN